MTKCLSTVSALALALAVAPALAAPGTTPVLRFSDGGPAYYHVGRYGGVCNGDPANGAADTAAINAIFADIRALPNNSTHPRIVFPGDSTRGFGACYITSTINATSAGGGMDALSSQNHITIDGGRLECHTSGTPCVDASGTRYLDWEYTIINSPSGATESSYGLQLARLRIGVPAGDHLLNHVIVQGFYTKAAVISFASEVNTWIEPFIANNDTITTTPTYAFLDDGCNHFFLTSAFTTIAIAPSTATSDLQDTFIGGQISAGANQFAPLFLCNTWHHEYLNTYISSNSLYAVHFFGIASGEPEMTTLDVHIENGTFVQNAILFENNAYTNLVIKGLKFRDNAANSSVSLFKAMPNLDSVTIHNFDVEVGKFSQGAGVKLFDDASRYAVDGGTIRIPALSNWAPPTATFSTNTSETVCIVDQNPICQTPTATKPFNRNPDFNIDQAFEGAPNLLATNGGIVIDGWHQSNSGVMLSSLTFQRVTLPGPPNNFPFFYNLQTTVTSTKAPVGTDFYKITSNIEGADISLLRWGLGSQGAPVIIDYCLNSSVAPLTIPITISSGVLDRSYVLNNVIPTANVWKCFTNLIPPDYIGTWAKTPDSIGMRVVIGYGFGTTVVGSCVANAWQDGMCIATPASSQFISQPNGSTLNLAAFRMYNSFVDNPELMRPFPDQLAQAQHWYRKSFQIGVKPAQNTLSSLGAISFQAPYQTTGTSSQRVAFPPMFRDGATQSQLTFFSTNAASANCYNASKNADSGAASATNISEDSFLLNCQSVPGDNAGDLLQEHFTADSGF